MSERRASDRVFVRGLEFEGNHGYTAAERRGTRRFRVSVALETPLTVAAASDKLADTVDYYRLCELVVAIGTRSTYKLLEALAGAIAAAIQDDHPAAAVEVEVEKLAPPCPGVPAACGVTLRVPARS